MDSLSISVFLFKLFIELCRQEKKELLKANHLRKVAEHVLVLANRIRALSDVRAGDEGLRANAIGRIRECIEDGLAEIEGTLLESKASEGGERCYQLTPQGFDFSQSAVMQMHMKKKEIPAVDKRSKSPKVSSVETLVTELKGGGPIVYKRKVICGIQKLKDPWCFCAEDLKMKLGRQKSKKGSHSSEKKTAVLNALLKHGYLRPLGGERRGRTYSVTESFPLEKESATSSIS